jgi:hypothetical protein
MALALQKKITDVLSGKDINGAIDAINKVLPNEKLTNQDLIFINTPSGDGVYEIYIKELIALSNLKVELEMSDNGKTIKKVRFIWKDLHYWDDNA